MEWTQVIPYAPDTSMTYWFSGIYKIVKYQSNPKIWHCYYLPDGYKNWGENVGQPNRYPIGNGMTTKGWPTLLRAQKEAAKHAETYTPKPATAARAAEIQKEYQLKELSYATL